MEAIEIIKTGRGTHFDPDITDIFIELEKEINLIAEKYND